MRKPNISLKRKPGRKKVAQQIRDKYRLIIYNDESFGEIISFRLTKLNVFILIGFVSIVMVLLVYFLIAFTPLKEYVIPDYPKLEEREKIIENVIKVDSLENQLQLVYNKMSILQKVINGEDFKEDVVQGNDTTNKFTDLNFERSPEDSLLRVEIEEFEALNVNFKPGAYTNPKYLNLYFHPPVKGTITNKYSAQKNHYATDIVAQKNSIIHSVLPGTVILDTWTIETGYIIIIQHSNDFVSVYKHNAKLLKKFGDLVEAGEGIAIIGNSGEYSTGPHLHFELWQQGKPVNSEDFIVY